MSSDQINRRDFLKLGAIIGAAAAVTALPAPAFSAPATRSLAECLEMGPVAMADASGPVSASWRSIRMTAAEIRNPEIRNRVEAILDTPAPTLTKGLGASEKKAVYSELTAKGLLKDVKEADFLPQSAGSTKAPQPFRSAPGSGYQSHHSYPGGLVTHTDLNVRMSLALYDNYRVVYDYMLDRDVIIAAQLLHDLHKPWVFQWDANGESRTELSLAGTGEHHVLGVAESIVRGLPAEVCVAQACAHNHPRTPADEAQVVGWLTAASIIAGVDPVKAGLLAPDAATLPLPRRQEGFVTHLGDHDWVLTVPAAQWLFPVMEKVAVRDYGISQNDLKKKPFNQFRNYVFSQATAMGLYETLASRGESEFVRTVHSIVTPA
ncbi:MULTISPECIES: twin-arginine translocation signal domain-containing protein [unclassified Pseudodesulfovibrio]|uniref:twin-arginine translocation signal domain-containing protein n=1 Tax=unclassified Pseudodesulfovibrio TaxID=2661612 RepID=UPI000FEBCF28|nr:MULTISPECIES: twin-arginine translocation signal domain-containing protein [unclassified Pseudodesulfovibrio]MCJ2166066.1 twin-arginine translocation signal domain-containing protein [Pseudodesulfovibrio sp. S3-i]RWU02511.1 metal-dependent phosphohydrolase [Pseudodesulfovibrio sp. S3]